MREFFFLPKPFLFLVTNERIFLLPIIIIHGKIFYFWSSVTSIVRDRILFWSPVAIIRDGILFWSSIPIIRDGILFWLAITVTSIWENYFFIVDNHYPRENFFRVNDNHRSWMFSFFLFLVVSNLRPHDVHVFLRIILQRIAVIKRRTVFLKLCFVE